MKRSMMILFAIASSLLSVTDGAAGEQHEELKRQTRTKHLYRVEESDLPSGLYEAVKNESSRVICDTLPSLTGFDMVVGNSPDGQTIQLAARGDGWNETMAGAVMPLKFKGRDLIHIGGESYARCSYFEGLEPRSRHLWAFIVKINQKLGLVSTNPYKSLIFCRKPEREDVMACLDPIRMPKPRGCKHFFTLKKTNEPVEASRKRKFSSTKEPAEEARVIEPAKRLEMASDAPETSKAAGTLIKINDGRYLSKEGPFFANVTISTNFETKRRPGTFEISGGERPVVLPNFDWVMHAGFWCLRPELTDPRATDFLIKRTFGTVTVSLSLDSIYICPLGVDRIWLVISSGSHAPQHRLVLTKDRPRLG